MARIKIYKKDGSSTRYFWSDKDSSKRTSKRVYKETDDGVKRMKNVRFNADTNQIHKV